MSVMDLEKLVLQRARDGLRPSAAQRKAAVSRLTATLSMTPLPGPDAAVNGPSLICGSASDPRRQVAGSTALGFSKSMMVTGILSGALVGFAAGYSISPGRASDMQRGIASSTDAVPQAAPRVAVSPPPASATPSATEATPAAATAQQTPASASNPRSFQEQPSGVIANSEPTFYEELSYVRRAQSALQRGDGTLALGLMQSLDELQPGGALLAERKVTRVLALCQLGRTEEAIALTRRALTGDSTTHVYRHRLSVSCARDALSEAGE